MAQHQQNARIIQSNFSTASFTKDSCFPTPQTLGNIDLMKFRLLSLLTFLTIAGTLPAQLANSFFAMDTIARGKPEAVVPLLKELGFAGLGGQAGDASMAKALQDGGLKMFNGYLTLEFNAETTALTDALKQKIDAMASGQQTLWLAIAKVTEAGKPAAKKSAPGDAIAAKRIHEIATYAGAHEVNVSLYPHTGFYVEQVEDALRLADSVRLPNVKVTFNLCHWLKVEGSERDPRPMLEKAFKKLDFVTINGADTGDTKSFGWDRLIQPLGKGTYDVAKFLTILKDLNYAGPIGFQGYGIKEDHRAVLTATMAEWKRLSGKP